MDVQQLKAFISDLPDDMTLRIGLDDGEYLVNHVTAVFADNALYFSESSNE